MTEAVVVVAHPRPGSFVHALAETAVAALSASGYGVTLHDLDAEQFTRPVVAGKSLRLPNLPAGYSETPVTAIIGSP
jgi:putative NADPH-quinone reductase